MALEQQIQEFQQLQQKLHAKKHLLGVLGFDSETVAPKGSTEARGFTLALISEELFTLQTSPETFTLLDSLHNHKSALDALTARQVELMRRDLKMLKNMPKQEYIDLQVLLNKTHEVWVEAKQKNDYKLFRPYLQQIIEATIRIASYIDDKKKPYDALLGQYEYGYTTADYDPFFKGLQEQLVPTILEISKCPAPDTKFLDLSYPIEKQRALSLRLMDLIHCDRNFCSIAEAEHPFSTHFSKYDVRITTHYHEHMPQDSLYSVIHEGGHALYELHTGDALQYSNLANGASLGLHESQSRFYENIIGRSREFMGLLLPLLQEIFPEQMQGVTEEKLYLALNKVSPSLIRTQADELTYSLHVLIRYEIEKRLIAGELSVEDAPKYWNKLYKDYLGVEVPSDSEGILQDVHWSGGSFGYFPTYSLGSAYGAQMLHKIEQNFSTKDAIASGNIKKIGDWLEQNVHVHGSLYDPKDILKMACGEDFNPQYYFDYLNKKFKGIYKI